MEQIAGFELSILNEIQPIILGDLFEEEAVEEEPADESDDDEDLDLSVDDFDEDPEPEAEEEYLEEDISESQEEVEEAEATSDEEAEAFDPDPETEVEIEDEPVAEAPELSEPEPMVEAEEEPDVVEEPIVEGEEVSPADEEVDDKVDESSEPDEPLDEEKTPEASPEEHDFEEDEEVSLNQKLADETTKTINEKFEKDESVTLADHHQQSKVTSIMEAISVNNRYMFVNDLFEGDKEEFTDAIERIEECESFDEAVEILVQEYARNYDWDMNSDEVKELLKVVFRKFR